MTAPVGDRVRLESLIFSNLKFEKIASNYSPIAVTGPHGGHRHKRWPVQPRTSLEGCQYLQPFKWVFDYLRQEHRSMADYLKHSLTPRKHRELCLSSDTLGLEAPRMNCRHTLLAFQYRRGIKSPGGVYRFYSDSTEINTFQTTFQELCVLFQNSVFVKFMSIRKN